MELLIAMETQLGRANDIKRSATWEENTRNLKIFFLYFSLKCFNLCFFFPFWKFKFSWSS